jgi:hypothetical protein
MKRSFLHLTAVLIFSCPILFGCSGSKNPDQAKEGKTSNEQTIDAVKQYGQKPIEKARAAQRLGDERVNAIDDAVNRQ